MPSRSGAVHVATTKRHYKSKTYTSHLLRRSFRVGRQVQHETLGNLSHLPDPLIDLIRRSLAGEIGVKLGRVLHRYKVGKHFETKIADGVLIGSRRAESIRREAELDGIYVLRTRESKASLPAGEAVRTHKSLAHVERAFRCLKGVDLRVRPIFHRTPERVRAHIFLCLLAYYVEWQMRRAVAPLWFADERLEAERARRDAVAPAQPSAAVKKKKASGRSTDGLPLHSWPSLLDALATRCQNRCRVAGSAPGVTFEQLTAATPLQQRAFELLGL